MSTPRHKKVKQIEPSTRTVASGHLRYLDFIGKGTYTVEGVAAPLEPSAEEFWQKVNCFPKDILPKLSLFDCQKLDEIIVEAMEAYAAAVSTNLQEELTSAKRMLYELTPEDIRGMAYDANALLQARVSELEKEITALRETK